MSDSQWQDKLAPMVRTLQIIVAALVAGTVFFLVIALFMAPSMERPNAVGPPMLTYIAIIFAVMDLLARMIVPAVIVNRGRQRIARGTWQLPPAAARAQGEFLQQTGDAGKLYVLFQTKTIVSAALIEGVAFFMLIAYMMEQTPLSLILAVVLIFGVAIHVPTLSGVIHWIEFQLDALRHQRELGP